MMLTESVWLISVCVILLILFRPWRVNEAVWACAGAALLVLLGALSPLDALQAAGRGTDVYLFLTGMMLLSELARREGFFDWLASRAVRQANGSRSRLFLIVFLVGAVVTTFLSNDATAVVLTPAVLAAVKKARATPLPYLLSCAFIANAASFVLPIANPANLVIYGPHMPPLGEWLRIYSLPSACAIAATYICLRFLTRADLRGAMERGTELLSLSVPGRLSAFAIVGTAAVLVLASYFHLDLGLPTFLAALAATGVISAKDRAAPAGVLRALSWSVLPLVAGLFAMVEAVNRAGALAAARSALRSAASFQPAAGVFSAAFGSALLSNAVNNLPVGLIASTVFAHGPTPARVQQAVLMGIDLGPNLSVSGSLATILWLVAIRREQEDVTAWQFLKFGSVVMPVALALALAALLVGRSG